MAEYRVKESKDQKLCIVSLHVGNIEENKGNINVEDAIFCVTIDNQHVLPEVQIYQSKPLLKLQDFQIKTIQHSQIAKSSHFELKNVQIINKNTIKIGDDIIKKGQVNVDLEDLISAEGHQNEFGSYLISFKYKTVLKFNNDDIKKFLREHNIIVQNKKELTGNLIKLLVGFAVIKYIAF